MKKIILSTFFVGGLFAVSAFGQNQNGTNNAFEAKAKKALKDAGCLDGINGSYITHYDVEVTPLLDNCYRVVLLPIPNPTIAEVVRLAPVGSVTICDGEVTSVTCGL